MCVCVCAAIGSTQSSLDVWEASREEASSSAGSDETSSCDDPCLKSMEQGCHRSHCYQCLVLVVIAKLTVLKQGLLIPFPHISYIDIYVYIYTHLYREFTWPYKLLSVQRRQLWTECEGGKRAKR